MSERDRIEAATVTPDDAADAALGYSLWDSENSTKMAHNAIEEHIERAQSVRRWLRIHGHDVVALAALSRVPAAAKENGWRTIETLHRIDTDVVLWNPCDGVYLLNITIGLPDLEKIRRDGVFSHWRKLEPPKPREGGGEVSEPYHVTERNGWSYVEGNPTPTDSGPWRYRWEAQEYADGLNEGATHTAGKSREP